MKELMCGIAGGICGAVLVNWLFVVPVEAVKEEPTIALRDSCISGCVRCGHENTVYFHKIAVNK